MSGAALRQQRGLCCPLPGPFGPVLPPPTKHPYLAPLPGPCGVVGLWGCGALPGLCGAVGLCGCGTLGLQGISADGETYMEKYDKLTKRLHAHEENVILLALLVGVVLFSGAYTQLEISQHMRTEMLDLTRMSRSFITYMASSMKI